MILVRNGQKPKKHNKSYAEEAFGLVQPRRARFDPETYFVRGLRVEKSMVIKLGGAASTFAFVYPDGGKFSSV